MKSRSAGNPLPDPLKIFMNAERFRQADLLLRSVNDQRIAVTIASPALILSAFASELYLKCIVCIETGELAHGHHLKNLYRRIEPSTRRSIEEKWDEYVSSPVKQRLYEALASINGRPVPVDFDWTLSEGSSAFTSLRYLHEVDDLKTKFLLGDFPNILREVIVQKRPQWAFMAHGPMTPVPGFEDPVF
jgi:HEPN domain-containing protein